VRIDEQHLDHSKFDVKPFQPQENEMSWYKSNAKENTVDELLKRRNYPTTVYLMATHAKD
jgi:hypothetical protein